MKRSIRKFLVLCILAAGICLLGGCQFNDSVEDLLTLPQLPLEYEELSQQINDLITQGYEYASPTNGRNIQSVQMLDLNGDGSDESVAFFRKTSDEKPLKIVVFHREEDTYQPLCTLESSGSEVESVTYADLTGDGIKEMIVGWKISADVQTVAAYEIRPQPKTLMRSNYVKFTVQTLDESDAAELIVLRSDEEGKSVAELYREKADALSVCSSCTLSSTMADLNRGSITTGRLDDKITALYITGVNDQAMAVTDILAYRQGALANVAENRHTGTSGVVYPYRQLVPQDIDGDGTIEIPIYRKNPADNPPDGLISWQRYDADGQATWCMDTYHCLSADWYLTLPNDWHERVSVIAVENGSAESQVTLRVDGDAVVALYAITGENRENRAKRGNRMILKRQTAEIYAGELMPVSEVYGADEEFLRNNFHLILGNWITTEN